MFQYKCTICRENKIRGLKPVVIDMLLFARFSIRSIVDVDKVQWVKLWTAL